MRVLVTGVAGQDGTLLARDLLAAGIEVHGMVHSDASTPAGVTLHRGDLADGQRTQEIVDRVQPDIIYNLGGISSVGYSWEHPALTGAVSGQGAVEVFEAAWRLQQKVGRKVPVVHASSAEVFGSPAHSPQTEQTEIAPISPYGAAKAYAQQMARTYRSQGLLISTLILYAHESTLRPPGFVTRKITRGAAAIAVRGHGTLTLGNLDAVRDWGWAPDYVDAMRKAAAHLAAGNPGTEYVVATGVGHTVRDFVATAFAEVGIDNWEDHVTVNPRLFRPADPALLIGDTAKIRNELDWAPTKQFREIVAAMCAHDLQLARSEE